ncbi:MAG: D-cysteine desulfhydrase family protein [bacterium]
MILTELPRTRFATLPTPIEKAERLSEALGGPEIYVKRDDMTGRAMGGNKIRKLEYLIADALRQDADVVVTTGGPQSNCVRSTATTAKHVGLDTVAVMYGTRPDKLYGNFMMTKVLSDELVFTGVSDRSSVDRRAEEVCERLRSAGRTPYLIPRGAAISIGAVGYVNCALELMNQLMDQDIDADRLILPSGSCGTQAGLMVGAKWLQSSFRIEGILVSRPRAESIDRLVDLSRKTIETLGMDLSITEDDANTYDDYIGDGFAVPTRAGRDAFRMASKLEGLFLDPVYTSKAVAGIVDLIESGEINSDETIVYLHTGGEPLLFSLEHGMADDDFEPEKPY